MDRRTLLKSTAAASLLGLAGCASPIARSIVDVATANGGFNTLLSAVNAAGLADTLAGPGPLTVFAPTDEAFAALPAGTVEGLLLPENRDSLVGLLSNHVVAGNYPASSLAGARGVLQSLGGGNLRIDGTNGVRVNNSNVIIPDVAASNGFIHAIDKVLL